MADAQKQAEESAEEQAQQSAVPTEQQKGQEEDSSQAEVQETEESLEAPAGDSEDLELPQKGVSERTKAQFEKLKEQLRFYRERLFQQTGNRAYEGEAEVRPLYDPQTGLVDIQALQDLQRRAYEAERKATNLEQRLVQDSQEAQVRELHQAYPELKNPTTKEAKELFNEAERIWLHSQAYPERYGGYALTQKQAADLAKQKMGNLSETTKQEAQRLEAKEQASLGASGRPTQGVQNRVASEEELEKLRVGTRMGNEQAMIARMRAIRQAQEASK